MIAPCEKCNDTGRVQGFIARISGLPADEDCACRPKKDAPEGSVEAFDVFDGLVFRSLNEKQMIERIVHDFLGVEDNPDRFKRKPIPSQERVERYVARLVEAFGAKLGGLTRKQLVSKTMAALGKRSRKRTQADWAAYHKRA